MSSSFQRRRTGEGAQAALELPIRSGRSITHTIQRWKEEFGSLPNFSAIAEVIGCHKMDVSRIFREQRHTPHIQQAVARVAGLSVEALFGDAAFHKVGARFLARRLDRRVSA